MQIVLAGCLVKLPGASGETGLPVVGFPSILRILPDVEVAVRIVFGLPAFHKPRMLVRCMVDHQVHDNPKPKAVCCRQHFVEIFHGSEIRHDIAVIGDVVSVVIVGGAIDRGEPDHIDPKLLQVGKMRRDSLQIADSVSIAVREGARIDLIDNCFLPPCLFLC